MITDSSTLFHIDRHSKTPLYYQIAENLRSLIRSGQLIAGEATPSEWELSDIYGVSRLTVRRAIDDLVRDGLLIRKHGVGTFVAHTTVAQIHPSELSFTRNMEQIGCTPSSRVISLQTIPASSEIAQHLDIEPGDEVFELIRIRLADDQPLMLETTYLSAERFPDLPDANLSTGSLYRFLSDHYRVDITALDQVLEPVILTDQEASLLEVDSGDPAILSEIVGFIADGTPIEFTRSLTCRGRGRFHFHFREGDVGKRHFSESKEPNINHQATL